MLCFRSAGARVNAKDNMWLTPLHRAVASRSEVKTHTHTHTGSAVREPRCVLHESRQMTFLFRSQPELTLFSILRNLGYSSSLAA